MTKTCGTPATEIKGHFSINMKWDSEERKNITTINNHIKGKGASRVYKGDFLPVDLKHNGIYFATIESGFFDGTLFIYENGLSDCDVKVV